MLTGLDLCRWPTTEPGQYIKLYENVAAVISQGAEQVVKWEESAEVVELISNSVSIGRVDTGSGGRSSDSVGLDTS